jgi:hypothetical protein
MSRVRDCYWEDYSLSVGVFIDDCEEEVGMMSMPILTLLDSEPVRSSHALGTIQKPS